MPKQVKELSAVEVKRLTRPGVHAVGGVAGLNLRIYESGARCWILRTRAGGKRRDYGIGGFPTVTLAQARERARETLDQLWRGGNPIDERRQREADQRAADIKRMTFERAARLRHDAKQKEFRSEKHRLDWISSLERHAFPVIGSIPVADIETAHVLEVLQPIWTQRTETATRVRQRMEKVFSWAKANPKISGYTRSDNPAVWKDNLEESLPTPGKIQKVRHHKAIAWHEVPAFMESLRQRQGMAARALEFAILTGARSGEVRLATWDEVDLDSRVWVVPEDRIKAGRRHTVPLSDDAVTLLQALPTFEGSPYIFPAVRGGALSDAAIGAVCKRMKVNATPHGFRSSFKDWCRTQTSYPDEVSELALAHVNDDKTRAAYARDELVDERARMMSEWAEFLRK